MFLVRFTLPHRKRVFHAFPTKQLAHVVVQMRSVVHFPPFKVLGNEIEHVAAKPVHALTEPKIDDFLELLANGGIRPIYVGLLLGKRVQIILVRFPIIRPRRAAEYALPFVWRLFKKVIIVVIGTLSGFFRLLKPKMQVRGMVGNQIHNHFDLVFFRFEKQALKIGKRAEFLVEISIIRNVVAVVVLRAFVYRTNPNGVCAKLLDIIELLNNAVDIPYAVAVAIEKAFGVNLIHR